MSYWYLLAARESSGWSSPFHLDVVNQTTGTSRVGGIIDFPKAVLRWMIVEIEFNQRLIRFQSHKEAQDSFVR